MLTDINIIVISLIALAFYYSTKGLLYQKIIVCSASFFVYYLFAGLFIFYFVLLIFLAFFGVKLFWKYKANRLSKFFGLLIPLSGLIWFKYYHFLISGNILEFQYILPAGVSFYTFQAISYFIDGRKSEKLGSVKFIDVVFYISFFPQVVAGPIVKSEFFIEQIELKKINWTSIFYAIRIIISGLLLKVFIADNIAEFTVLLNSNEFLNYSGGGSRILLMLSYSFQILMDFSGYTLMALGFGQLFGYKLPSNFRMPYLSLSFKEFWKRWHITLGSFLMEYLYIGALGGSRNGRTYLNLILTMIIGGAWHGGTLSYILWGAYHGTLLVIERLFNLRFGLLVFVFVSLGWLFFIYPNIYDVINFIISIDNLDVNIEVLPVCLYLVVGMLIAFSPLFNRLVYEPDVVGSILFLVLIIYNPGIKNDFIYFQF